jgi:hypothetical protein
MTTVNGLPAHILLVHLIVVLLPLAALLLVGSTVWPAARRRLAGPNALLSVVVVALVPITTDAGEWLERRVASTALVRAHTELGDTAIYVAIPVAVLAVLVWWRERESQAPQRNPDLEPVENNGSTKVETRTVVRRTFLAPTSTVVTVILTALSIVAAVAAAYVIYRIGDSGAQAAWQGQFSTAPAGR